MKNDAFDSFNSRPQLPNHHTHARPVSYNLCNLYFVNAEPVTILLDLGYSIESEGELPHGDSNQTPWNERARGACMVNAPKKRGQGFMSVFK